MENLNGMLKLVKSIDHDLATCGSAFIKLSVIQNEFINSDFDFLAVNDEVSSLYNAVLNVHSTINVIRYIIGLRCTLVRLIEEINFVEINDSIIEPEHYWFDLDTGKKCFVDEVSLFENTREEHQLDFSDLKDSDFAAGDLV